MNTQIEIFSRSIYVIFGVGTMEPTPFCIELFSIKCSKNYRKDNNFDNLHILC